MNKPGIPPAQPVLVDESIEVLSTDACWIELAGATLGRLAVSTDSGPDIFQVNFTVKDGQIYLRSAPGSKLKEITKQPIVAFESDGQNGFSYWSVVVRGTAERLSYDEEILASGVAELHTATQSEKFNYIRIAPVTVSGRLFSKSL